MKYFLWRVFGLAADQPFVAVLPVVTAVTISAALSVFPLLVAQQRLMRRDEK